MGEPAISQHDGPQVPMTHKKVKIAGLTEGLRQKELERKKTKLEKLSWELHEYFDDGMTKSYAVFKRPTHIKDPISPAAKIGGAIFLSIIAIGIFNRPSVEEMEKSSKQSEQYKKVKIAKEKQKTEKLKSTQQQEKLVEAKKENLAQQKKQLHERFKKDARDKLYQMMISKRHPVAKKKIMPELYHFYHGDESFFHCMFQGSSCGIFQAKQAEDRIEILWVNGSSKEWELKGVTQSSHKTDIGEIFKEASGIKEVYEGFIRSYLTQVFSSVDVSLDDSNFNLKWLFVAVPLNQWNRLGREQKRNIMSEMIVHMKETYSKGVLKITIGQPNVTFGEAEWSSFSDSPEIAIKI